MSLTPKLGEGEFEPYPIRADVSVHSYTIEEKGRAMSNVKVNVCRAALLAAALALPLAARANAVGDFYKGKTVAIIVGFGAGGGYDLYARTLARHLGNHLAGHPNVVVQNMVGAGGVTAANHVYAIAAKDGTVIAAVSQYAAMYELLDGKGAKYDAAKFQWLGSMTFSDNVAYTWNTTGIKTFDDLKKREIPVGGSGVISDANIYPNIMNALLGTKFKIINGYSGTNETNLAIERGELFGRGGGSYASLVSTRPEWLRDHKITILIQVGTEKEPDLPNVPLLTDLVKPGEARQIADLVTMPVAIGYNEWMAPGVPKDRVQAMRAAYAAVLKDPALLAEAKKEQLEIRPKTGDQLGALVKDAARIPKPVLEKTKAILGW
jgi:tripartite-type tricarboxylate transporter receptor subunit TctC